MENRLILYVSPKGRDDSAGSFDAPLFSVQEALSELQIQRVADLNRHAAVRDQMLRHKEFGIIFRHPSFDQMNRNQILQIVTDGGDKKVRFRLIL